MHHAHRVQSAHRKWWIETILMYRQALLHSLSLFFKLFSILRIEILDSAISRLIRLLFETFNWLSKKKVTHWKQSEWLLASCKLRSLFLIDLQLISMFSTRINTLSIMILSISLASNVCIPKSTTQAIRYHNQEKYTLNVSWKPCKFRQNTLLTYTPTHREKEKRYISRQIFFIYPHNMQTSHLCKYKTLKMQWHVL